MKNDAFAKIVSSTRLEELELACNPLCGPGVGEWFFFLVGQPVKMNAFARVCVHGLIGKFDAQKFGYYNDSTSLRRRPALACLTEAASTKEQLGETLRVWKFSSCVAYG